MILSASASVEMHGLNRQIRRYLQSTRFRVYSIAGVFLVIFTSGWWLEVTLPIASDHSSISPQIWAHRGSGGRVHPENSIKAVKLGVEEGFSGIEIDAFYIPEEDKIIVAHDRPDPKNLSNYDVLSDYAIPQGVELWLDLKNLAELESSEIAKLAGKLKKLPFHQQTLVESKSVVSLYKLRKHDVKTVLWLENWSVRQVGVAKFLARAAGVHAVSVDIGNLPKVEAHFGNRSIFVFTVNDPAMIRHVTQSEKIAVVLTDLSCQDSGCAR